MTRVTALPETVTLYVPFRVVKRGGRKEMQLPDDAPHQRTTDNTLVKALAGERTSGISVLAVIRKACFSASPIAGLGQ